jgi:hypothetical protein
LAIKIKTSVLLIGGGFISALGKYAKWLDSGEK